jgi:hypothetical protein
MILFWLNSLILHWKTTLKISNTTLRFFSIGMRVRRMGSIRFIAYGISPGQGRAGPKAGGEKLGPGRRPVERSRPGALEKLKSSFGWAQKQKKERKSFNLFSTLEVIFNLWKTLLKSLSQTSVRSLTCPVRSFGRLLQTLCFVGFHFCTTLLF